MNTVNVYFRPGVNYLDPKRLGLVTHWCIHPHGYYKPIDTRLVPQQLAVEEAIGAKH